MTTRGPRRVGMADFDGFEGDRAGWAWPPPMDTRETEQGGCDLSYIDDYEGTEQGRHGRPRWIRGGPSRVGVTYRDDYEGTEQGGCDRPR